MDLGYSASEPVCLTGIQYAVLTELVAKYPRAAGPLFQTYNDLALGELYHAALIVCDAHRIQRNNGKTLRLSTSLAAQGAVSVDEGPKQ